MAGLGMVKVRVAVQGVMDWALVTAFLVVLNAIITVWVGARISMLLSLAVEDLDNRIALAIQSVIEKAGGDFEPVNPVQAAVAQFITQRMQPDVIQAAVVTRDQDGKFT